MSRAIVLAAGKGTRMKSARPKVLHELCGRTMLWCVLRALREAGVDDVTLVVNRDLEPHVKALSDVHDMTLRIVVQEPQLGTGHAVRVALEATEPAAGTTLVAYADMPLVPAAVYAAVADAQAGGAALALVTAHMPLPSNFGRILRDGDDVRAIVEARDATPEQLAVDEMNAGIYAFDDAALRATIVELRDDNAQREYYLTDTLALLHASGAAVRAVACDDFRLVMGVNDRIELARARAVLNERLCEEYMRAGVTIVDPATTYLEPDLELAPDVTIWPNTAIGGRTSIGAGAEIGPNCRLRDVRLAAGVRITESVMNDVTAGEGVTIGPFAQLRGPCVLGADVHLGNFVELKKTTLGDGVRAGHLTYLGDATIGARTNIGAGTITCNYDGVRKHETIVGADAFVGSNSSLVAPVEIGDGALTGAGAVVIRDVPAGERVVGNPARPLRSKKTERT